MVGKQHQGNGHNSDINFEYAAVESGEGGAVDYSALAVCEVGEIKKTDETAEPMESSGVR